MNVQKLSTTSFQAMTALREYKQHRDVYDKRDWEIERIYRQIAKGKTVISVNDAIRNAGLDEQFRPRLAIMRADQTVCECDTWESDLVTFKNVYNSKAAEWYFQVPWSGRPKVRFERHTARLPRIPPQHRPAAGTLSNYHILWEADWTDLPHDPYLLKRIGKDAWVVLACWNLSEVEMSVLRAHRPVS